MAAVAGAAVAKAAARTAGKGGFMKGMMGNLKGGFGNLMGFADGDTKEQKGQKVGQFLMSNQGQNMLGKAINGVTALGSAIKARREARKAQNDRDIANNQAVNTAKQQVALASNGLANEASQKAINDAQERFDQNMNQTQAMDVVTGATPEQALAQQQAANNSLANMYAQIAENNGNAYAQSLNSLGAAEGNVYESQAKYHDQLAASANKVKDNAMQSLKKNSGIGNYAGGTTGQVRGTETPTNGATSAVVAKQNA